MDTPPRILLLGYAKSGTTALYSQIKKALGQATAGVFEPQDFAPVAAHLQDGAPLLAKVLIPAGMGFLDRLLEVFQKTVLLVRDPRDVLVSALLYGGGYEILWQRSAGEIAEALAWLERKQASPRSVPLLELFRHFRENFSEPAFFEEIRQLSGLFVELAGQPGFFVCRYEDFVQQRVEGLEAYLGLALRGHATVEADFQRVVRTRGSGSWRDWFTERDVAVFGPLLEEYLARFGYDPRDWALAPSPHIEPRHAAEYVKKLIAERRQREGLPALA